jgi:hypothetical protein
MDISARHKGVKVMFKYAMFVFVVFAFIGCSDPPATTSLGGTQGVTAESGPQTVVVESAPAPSEYNAVLGTPVWVFEEILVREVRDPSCNNFLYAEVEMYAYAKGMFSRKVCFLQTIRDEKNFRVVQSIKLGAEFQFHLQKKMGTGEAESIGQITHNDLEMFSFRIRVLFRVDNLATTRRGVAENLSREGVRQGQSK